MPARRRSGGGGRPHTKKLCFLIAYGPTREPVDPVRYLSNYSTGAMGKNLVLAAQSRGHAVESVECPTRVQTACELDRLMQKLLPKADVVVMAAAVADARPDRVSAKKIKKDRFHTIRLVKNPDVLANLAKNKKKNQVFVGFGLESDDLAGNGAKKMKKKSLEFIILQRVTEKNKPFGEKAIDAYLLESSGKSTWYPSVQKEKLAGIVVAQAEACFVSKNRD